MILNQWRDPFGFIHLNKCPDTEESENGPMFTGLNMVLLQESGELNFYHCDRFLKAVEYLCTDGEWYTTPISTRVRFSNDNFAGIIMGLKVVISFAKNKDARMVRRAKGILSNIPLFHKQLDHPRDFVLVGFAKWPWVFCLLIWITSLAFIVSCYQTYKVRNENKIIKTDRKILTYGICKSMNMKVTFWFCNLAMLRKRDGWKFNDWSGVFSYYFKNEKHPNNYYIKLIETEH